MSARRFLNSASCVLLILGLGLVAFADRLVLKNGKIVEGTIIKQGDRYWVKNADGSTQYVPLDDVDKLLKGSGGGPAAGAGGASTIGFSSSLAATQRKANGVDSALAAITIWQDFIDSKPSEADAKVAQEELARWKAMAENGGERINGKWVTGDEYKSVMSRYRSIMSEATKLLSHDELIKGAEKVEEARKIYPNDFMVNFWLGYLELKKQNWDKSIPYFEAVLKSKPNLPEAMANIGVAKFFKHQYSEGVVQMHKAAKQGDSEEIAYDLISMINMSPPAFQRSAAGKAAIEDARLLSYKYKINQNISGNVYYVRPREESVAEHGEHKMWCGTGFIVQPDGLILTNRHVAKDASKLMVMLHGGQQKSAEVVKIDDEQDLALIRLKNVDKQFPTVRLASADIPMDGAECTVIGYPLVDRLGGSPKITHGIVSSSIKKPSTSAKRTLGMEDLGTDEADVLIDAKVNPGNSGGPILDKYGNVMAIVSMKSLSSETEDSYGIGISAGRIRKFLAKNKVELPLGERGLTGMSVEDIAARVEPAAVLILATK